MFSVIDKWCEIPYNATNYFTGVFIMTAKNYACANITAYTFYGYWCFYFVPVLFAAREHLRIVRQYQ
ncbi:hypothetical protein CE91St65_22580 [[Clostridium] symbiosum]|nr:hypothetical protein CE91St65_22580 [[Clostridium] symbiosum]BDF29283.1 hypothetical protein CE91St66_22600 [[Clostridium] symbiosum]